MNKKLTPAQSELLKNLKARKSPIGLCFAAGSEIVVGFNTTPDKLRALAAKKVLYFQEVEAREIHAFFSGPALKVILF